MVYAKYITLVNIIFNKPIVPELIQNQFNKDNLINTLKSLIKDQKGQNFN